MLAVPTKRPYKICKADISYLQNDILNLISGKFYFISQWKCFPNSIHDTLYYPAASPQETIHCNFTVHKFNTLITQIAFCTLQKHHFTVRVHGTRLCKGRWLCCVILLHKSLPISQIFSKSKLLSFFACCFFLCYLHSNLIPLPQRQREHRRYV